MYYYVDFNPVALSLGPLQIHWYGVTYMAAFIAFWLLGNRAAKTQPWHGWKSNETGDFLFYGMLGVVLGGRIGYVLFYGFESLLQNPLFLFKLWEGGMSFHGGLLGVILAMRWYAGRTGRTFFQVADFVAPLVPIGLAFGRLGNFIGGELWGRYGDVPWAMIFPNALRADGWQSEELHQAYLSGALDMEARHPSQLYQAGLEGFALFILLLWFSSKHRPTGSISGLFLLGYGVFRLIVEFFRQPDGHLGYLAFGWLTMGMVLSLPMIVIGALMMRWAYKRNPV